MSKKGQRTTSEALLYKDFTALLDCLHQDGLYFWELYFRVSFATACRVSDVLTLRWKDVLGQSRLFIKEKKTGKLRKIRLGDNFQKHLAELYNLMDSPDTSLLMFCNHRTGKPITRQHINQMMKAFRFRYQIPVEHFSSHSIRKTFGRAVYDKYGQSMDAVTKLCLIFNHGDPKTTMTYLGIRQSEIDELYENVDML